MVYVMASFKLFCSSGHLIRRNILQYNSDLALLMALLRSVVIDPLQIVLPMAEYRNVCLNHEAA